MERPAFERRLTPCAEFPNDNPDLHHGATWVCLELRGELACERHRSFAWLPPSLAPASAPVEERDTRVMDTGAPIEPEATMDVCADVLDDDDDPIEIVDELSFDDEEAVLDEGENLPAEADAVERAREGASADPFAHLVSSLKEVARALGAGDEGVACLDALFGQARLAEVAAGERVAAALVAGGVIAPSARGLVRSSAFTARVVAWHGILRGESEDFSLPDGGALEPLDEWAADVLARIVGPPARAESIRRDLRRRGIAAFGLVAEAA